MRKNLFFGLFATIILLLTAACQKENDLLGNSEATISFEISTPQMATRAFSDGTTATQLQYAVYDKNNARITRIEPVTTTIEGSKHIDIQLAAGKTYKVLFWAAAPDAPYKLDFTNLKMNVVYTDAETNYKALCNDEHRDAFYCYYEVTADRTKTEKVTLTRPFAQLNIGTNDLNKLDGVSAEKTSVKVDIFSTLNLVDGTVEGLKENQLFALNTRPVDTDAAVGEFPVDNYDYLAMNYLLVGKNKKVVDVEFSYGNESKVQTRTFTGIPVMANYRTNIYGALLTNNVGFDVEIEEDFDEESPINTVIVNTAQELQESINNNEGEEIVLGGDINLGNTALTPAAKRAKDTNPQCIIIPAGKKIKLNLGNHTMSGIDNTESNFGLIQNYGNLTIKGKGHITLKATTNSGWNRYSAVVSNHPGATLTVEKKSIIEHLGGTDMAYGIDALTNGNIGDVNTTIDGATIISTYRAIRQFLNSDSKENNLTVKAGSKVEGENNGIFFQDTNTKANKGKITVEDNAEVNGTYLFVTEGSTDWPVEVSIAASSIGEKGVTYKNVPERYAVVNDNGIWKVDYFETQYVLKTTFNIGNKYLDIRFAFNNNNAPLFIDYGDGTRTADTNHTYASAGEYTIKFYFNEPITEIPFSCYGSNITSIVVPNTVTKIGDLLFYGSSLINVIFEEESQLKSIGMGAFANCNLTELVLPNSIEEIGIGFVTETKNLEHISGGGEPYGRESINGSYYYWDRNELNKYVILAYPAASDLKKIQTIGGVDIIIERLAFKYCHNLTDVNYGKMTEIRGANFSNCDNLETINLNYTTIIEDGVLSNCPKLKGHTLPNVKTIGTGSFCNNDKMDYLSFESGFLTTLDGIGSNNENLTSIKLPYNIKTIKESFNENTALTTIKCYAVTPPTAIESFKSVPTTATLYVPARSIDAYRNADFWKNFSDIREIEYWGDEHPAGHDFSIGGIRYIVTGAETVGVTYEYEKLSGNVSIPAGIECSGKIYYVTSIEPAAFNHSIDLTAIELPNTITSIGELAFMNCSSLSNISLGENIETIDDYAFQYCSNLETITLPSSTKALGIDIFNGCDNLSAIYVKATTPPISKPFDYTDKSIPVYIPTGCKTAYAEADGWKEFTNIIEMNF